jgi:transcriptional regulator with XRE-family HTH domain
MAESRVADGLETIVAGIGPKIRFLRQQRNLSLQQLAERCGVSPAAIHKIERNGMVPTITTLMKLAGALNRSVGFLVDEEDETGQLPKHAVLVRATDRKRVYTSKGGLQLRSVSGPYGRFWMAGAHATVEPGADSGPRPMDHPGEELIFMLDGALTVTVAGEEFMIRRGDALHFRTDRAHSWRNAGKKPAQAVWLALRST